MENSKYLHYLQDEKALVKDLLRTNPIGYKHCNKSNDMVTFFEQNKPRLIKECTDFKIFSHCQVFYLFQYDTGSRSCHGYIRERCENVY